MTTTEKIGVGIAIVTALGVGGLLTALLNHFLSRREKDATIREKDATYPRELVQTADTLMTRIKAENADLDERLSRAQHALARARQEGEELRAKLASSDTPLFKALAWDLSQRLRETEHALGDATLEIEELRVNLERRDALGLGERVEQILKLAEEQAADHLTEARREAEFIRREAGLNRYGYTPEATPEATMRLPHTPEANPETTMRLPPQP
jgi:chromosome segregation ATPase